MPSKGKNKKSSLLSSTRISNLAELTRNVYDLQQIVEIIHTQLQIPDLSTKAGLKRVYFKFDHIASRLDAAFTRYEHNDKIVSGVVAIYTELCVDSILRARLFEDPGEDAECRRIALHVLTSAAHHGGSSSLREDVARNASVLVQTLKDHSDEQLTAESIIDILSNAVCTAVDGEYRWHGPQMPELQSSLDMKTMLELTLHHMRQSYASKSSIQYGLDLILASAMYSSNIFRSVPDLDMFLVAGLKSKTWDIRGICFGAILRSHIVTSVHRIPSLGLQLLSPEFFVRWPPHLFQILEQYGLSRCFVVQLHHVSTTYLAVFDSWEKNRDHYALGAGLADLTLMTEYCLPARPSFPVEEIIPRCLQELRARGTSADMDRADVLEMKLLNTLRDWDRSKSKAQQFLARNPDSAYIYHALALVPTGSDESALDAAKKGLKCTGLKDNNPHLYFQLLRRAVELAADLGICYLHKERQRAQGKMMWEEAIAFLMSALEDSRTFVNEAPPDHPCMTVILHWNIILEITMQGPKADLKIIEAAMKKLKISEEIAHALQLQIHPTHTRQAAQLIMNLFVRADKEWGRDIKSMNARLDDQIPPPDSFKAARDDLSARLSDMSLETLSCSNSVPEPKLETHMDDFRFKRCSWCLNASVVLKKCAGCESTRYCDNLCQREHWPEHKKDCKGKGRAM
ncbi:hypothetical protein F5878DRAFT_666647 [Lentinula raphanica]|uniref:MYND-type domain-containing protein n=1 Tax=Lentinula raphanica TaxID=153919 RepID=A0AA38NXB0_9AGAR|nr:hypothetical protein F5878DRAFT_666647 [Lentinula raphanica]